MPTARVTNRTDYAVRAVVYLSLQDAGRVVPIPEIASETGLSVKFLEEILLLLRTAGIVQSRRGKQGGYSLLRSPHEMTVANVVQALEGEISELPPEDEEGSEHPPYRLVTRNVFQAAAAAWWKELEKMRISDLADEFKRLAIQRTGANMFYI